MSVRRTVAPDMVGCCFLLYAGTLLFAVLRAPYFHRDIAAVVSDLAIYGGLTIVSAAVAAGLFQRRSAAWLPGMLLSLAAVVAGATAFHVPDTAQLPAGVLGVTGLVLLWARRGEFAAAEPPRAKVAPAAGADSGETAAKSPA
jgi:hypothetical protein